MLTRRWPWVLLAVAMLVAAAFFLLARSRAVDVVAVVRAPVLQSVIATGRLATPARIEISSQSPARIERVLVRENDEVRSGSPLIELRSDEAQAALALAQAELAGAQAQLSRLIQVQRPVTEQQLLQASAAQRLAEQESSRIRELHARGFVSQAQVDNAAQALVQTRSATRAAQAQAQGSRAGGVEEALASSRRRQAQASVAAARARLEVLVLRAPAAARVLVRDAEAGDTAQPGVALLTLALDGPTRIIATVDEKNLAYVRLGMQARAIADAFPERGFEAVVSYIAPSVDPRRGSVEVWLRVPQPAEFLKPDMTVSVEILVGRNDSALRLPAQALRDADTLAPSVLVLRDGRAVRLAVKTGLRGVGVVEIRDGLQAGDRVILPSTPVDVGDRVRARAAPPAHGRFEVPPALGG